MRAEDGAEPELHCGVTVTPVTRMSNGKYAASLKLPRGCVGRPLRTMLMCCRPAGLKRSKRIQQSEGGKKKINANS